MELVEHKIGYGNYYIFLPRNYTLKFCPINTGVLCNIISTDGSIEKIHGEIYIGIDQNKKNIIFDNSDIIENIEQNILNENSKIPIYYCDNKYHTGIIINIMGGAVDRFIRILGTEDTKDEIISLINIISRLNTK